jgi:hypothetical protein
MINFMQKQIRIIVEIPRYNQNDRAFSSDAGQIFICEKIRNPQIA